MGDASLSVGRQPIGGVRVALGSGGGEGGEWAFSIGHFCF